MNNCKRSQINERVIPCPEMMAPVSLIVIDCCGLSFSSTRKNCIPPAAIIFNDVIKLVSRMAKPVKNVHFNATRPIFRIFPRLSFQRPEEAVNSENRCWCYCAATVETKLKVFHSYKFFACTRGSVGTGISDTVRCLFHIKSKVFTCTPLLQSF